MFAMLRGIFHRTFLLLLLGSGLALAGEAEWREHMEAGEAAQKRGDKFTATTSFDAALREAESFGPHDRRLAITLSWVAANHQAQGRLAEAENHFRRALAIREATDGPDHFEVSRILNSIAVNYARQGRFAEAEPLWTRAIAIAEKTYGPDHLSVATGLNSLGHLKYQQGRYAEAEALHLRALAIREKARGPEHALLVADLGGLAALYFKTGDFAKAESFSTRLLTLREKLLGPDHADVAKSLYELGDVRRAQGRLDVAEALYLRALQILKSKSTIPAQRDAATVQAKLDELRRMGGRSAEPPQSQQPIAKPPAQESYRPSQTELAALVQCEQAVLGEMDKDTKIRSGIYDVVYGRWLIVGKGAEEIIRCLVASHGWIALSAPDGRRGAQAPRFQGRNAEAPQPQQQSAKPSVQEASKRGSAAGLFVARSQDNPSPLWTGLDATVEETHKDGRVSIFKIHEHAGRTPGNAGRFFICTMFSLAKQRGYISYRNANPIDGRHVVIFLEKYDEDIQAIIDNGYREYEFFGHLGAKEVARLEQMCALAR